MAESSQSTTAAEWKARRRRMMVGVVTSAKMNKTRVVRVERRFPHTKYGKYIARVNTFKVHDEKNESREGDRVEIVECRPLSRDKRWRLKNILTRAEA